MTDLASLGLRVDSTSVKAAASDLDRLTAAGARAERAASSITRTWDLLRDTIAAAGIGLGLRELIQYADTWKILEARVRLVTSSQSELRAVQAELFDVAQRTRQAYESTVDLYARVARGAQTLGRSQKELLEFTETVNQAIQVGGSTAAEAAGGVIQFGQALASGKLQGDELRAVLENMPRLAQAIADGLGTTVGKLRELAADGKLTSQQLFDAVYKQRARLQAEFEKIPLTVGQAFTKLQNEVLRYVGLTDQARGSSSALAAAIGVLAKNVTLLGDALTALGAIAATVVGGRLGLASLAALANPLTAIVATLAAAGVAAYTFRDRVFELNGELVTISDLATELWNDIKTLFQDGADLASEFWKDLKVEAEEANATIGNWAKQFNSFVSSIGNDIATTWDNAIERVSLTLDTLWQNFKSVFSSISNLAEAVWKDIAAGFESAASGDFSSIGFSNTKAALASGFQLRGFSGGRQQAYNNVLASNVYDDADAAMGAGAIRSELYNGPSTRFKLGWTPYAQNLIGRASERGMARSVQDDIDAALGAGANRTDLSKRPEQINKITEASKEAKKAIENLKEAMAGLKLAADFGEKIADAARVGQGAVLELEAEFEATKLVQKAVADGARFTKEQYEELVKTAKEDILRKKFADLRGEIELGNRELERGNLLAAKEIELIGAAPEIRARELAILKTKLEFEARGINLAKENNKELQEAFDTRVKLLEQQELLNIKKEQIDQARELWLEPFRNAVSGIQDMFANVWRNILDGGVNSFKDIKKQVIAIVKELAVQILTLLTVRPVINFVVDGLGLQGALPGFGGTGTGGGIGSIIGNIFGGGGSSSGGGLFGGSLFGGGGSGGFGNLFGGGSIGSFLSKPLHSIGIGSPGLDPTGASAYLGLAESGGIGGMLGGLSIGQGLGAIGGLASGIMQLTQGGTANTISGITSMIGAGVSLIPGVGQILGPLISIAGPLLGGLFGKKPKIPKMKAQLMTGAPGSITSGPDTLFQGTDFVHTTPFGLLGFSGQGTNNRFDDPEGDAGTFLRAVAEMDRAIAELLTQSQIDKVAAALQSTPGLKTSWKKAFDNEGFDMVKDRLTTTLSTLYGGTVAKEGLSGIARGNDNIEELINRAGEVIQVANAIEGLGLVSTAAEKAIESVNEQFDELKKKAELYGFAASEVAKIEAERRIQVSKIAGDFNKGVADMILGIDDPYALAKQQLAESQDERRKEALYLKEQYEKGLIDTLVDINALETLFGKERVKLAEQSLAQTGQSWKSFVDGLLIGPLSAKSNREQYEMQMGRFGDVSQRAQAYFAANDNLDPALAAEFQREAIAALQWSRTYMASSVATADLYEQILELARQFGGLDVPGMATGGIAGPGLLRVGERGPEMLRLLQPARIYSRDASSQIDSTAGLGEAIRTALREAATEQIRTNADGQDVIAALLRSLIAEMRTTLREIKQRDDKQATKPRRGIAA